MTNKVCLVTGATGFIGQNLVSALVAKKYKIIALGKPNDDYCSSIFKENNIKISTNPNFDFNRFNDCDVQLFFGDIADTKFLSYIFSLFRENNLELEFVLHLAATATIQQALAEELETWKTNYDGTVNILNQSLDYFKQNPLKFKGFFYASTDKVYGEGSFSSYMETDELKPLPYPYDQSKAKSDELIRKVAKSNNFPAIIYRFCNVYGPGDYHKSRIIPGTLYRLLYTNDAPLLKMYKNPDGNHKAFYRDLIYIKDLTNAICLLLNHLRKNRDNSSLIGEVFNLGTDNSYSMKDVIHKVSLYSNSNKVAKVELVNNGEIKNQSMNYQKLNKTLGFAPKYSLDKGIKETVNWYVNHKGEIDEKFI